MSTEGFYFDTPADLMPFWRAVRMFKIDDEKTRVMLLRKFVARKEAKYIRDMSSFVKGKRILRGPKAD